MWIGATVFLVVLIVAGVYIAAIVLRRQLRGAERTDDVDAPRL